MLCVVEAAAYVVGSAHVCAYACMHACMWMGGWVRVVGACAFCTLTVQKWQHLWPRPFV